MNFNNIGFKGHYIIPFNQIKDSQTMRSIGEETSKFVDKKDMMQDKEGIVVNIDDNKSKEYEAIIAKYGVNIKKYDGHFKPNTDLEMQSYSYMVNKLYPKEAQEKIDAYKALNDKEKGNAYLEVYSEFKNSPYSNEYQAKINTPTSFKANNTSKKNKGTFSNKSFEVECKETLKERLMSGKVDDLNFNIKHSGKIFKDDIISGNIGDKELDLKVKGKFTKNCITGKLGDEPIDLEASPTLNGYRIKGKFKNKDIDIKLNSKLAKYTLESENMNLEIKNKSLFRNNLNVEGKYNEDPDLIPILMDTVYCLEQEELIAAMAMTTMVAC